MLFGIFTQSLSSKEILGELEISKDDYYKDLSISKDEDLELYLKTELNSCFANNHFDVVLKACQANMDIPSDNFLHYVFHLCLSIQKWKRIAIILPTILSKQTARTRSSEYCKCEQNKFWIIWWLSWPGSLSV